jgi:hypothetical protein
MRTALPGGSFPAPGLTKEGAKEALSLVQKDKAFAARCLAGEADAVRKFTRLHGVAFAGEWPGRHQAGVQQCPCSF